MPQFFRSIYFDIKYMIEEIGLKIKYLDRPCDFKTHWRGLMNTLFFHPWYCLKRGIRNLWIWFPLIWKNDCWDYTSMTNLMDKQMKEMQDFFESDLTHLMKANHVAKQIKWTRKLYDMWIEEYYAMKHYNRHHAKWDKDKHKSFLDPLNSVACSWDKWGEPTVFRCVNTMSEEESVEYREGSAKAYAMDKKCFDLYIKNLSKMRNWWD